MGAAVGTNHGKGYSDTQEPDFDIGLTYYDSDYEEEGKLRCGRGGCSERKVYMSFLIKNGMEDQEK